MTATATANGAGKLTAIGGDVPTNDAEDQIALSVPYIVRAELVGDAALLLHAWSVEAVAEKATAAKGSAAKKTDNLESYVYRDADRRICIPGEYLRMATCMAAKYQQDPRSPRKSAFDMFKAGIVVLTELAPICSDAHPGGHTDWEYVDQRRVSVQRSGITRSRPAYTAGWRVGFDVQVLLPEYVSLALLQRVMADAGRLVGLADFRPTYGRFHLSRFERVSE